MLALVIRQRLCPAYRTPARVRVGRNVVPSQTASIVTAACSMEASRRVGQGVRLLVWEPVGCSGKAKANATAQRARRPDNVAKRCAVRGRVVSHPPRQTQLDCEVGI